MRDKLVEIAKWLAKHVKIASRDLNKLERGEHDDGRKPHSASEIRIKLEF